MGNEVDVINDAVAHATRREGKYLTFSLAGEEYGIGILKVREIIGMMPITPVPETPQFVKGVINLRGKVIPVIDLRLRFGLTEIDYTERTCIIVVEIQGEAAALPMGIVVDAVSEVLNIRGEDIEDTPAFGVQAQHRLHPGDGQDGQGASRSCSTSTGCSARMTSCAIQGRCLRRHPTLQLYRH